MPPTQPTRPQRRSTQGLFEPLRAGEQDRTRGRFLTTSVTSLVATHMPVAPAGLATQDLFGQLRW
jgi:hypothetical protein